MTSPARGMGSYNLSAFESNKIVTPATQAKDMHTFLRSFNTFTHISGTLLLQKFVAVLRKIPVTAPSFHASTHFHTEIPSNTGYNYAKKDENSLRRKKKPISSNNNIVFIFLFFTSNVNAILQNS